MALRPVQVNIKALDHSAVGRFWAEALGWSVHSGDTTYVGPVGGFAWPDPVAVGVDVVPVSDPTTPTKNRVHLDVRVATGLTGDDRLAALEAEGDRLEALGARRVRLMVADEDNESCLVMQDVEGNEFCLD